MSMFNKVIINKKNKALFEVSLQKTQMGHTKTSGNYAVKTNCSHFGIFEASISPFSTDRDIL